MLDGCTPWPEEFAERYRAAGRWRDETLGELLARQARDRPGKTALVVGAHRWSYAELDARTTHLAGGLHAAGIGPGDRVVVQLPNLPELVPLLFALFRIGALPVMALPAHRGSEIGYFCEFTEAVAYVIPDTHAGFDHRELAAEVAARVPTLKHVLVAGDVGDHDGFTALDGLPAGDVSGLPRPDPADVALFLLSGGTTGVPKLVPRGHQEWSYSGRAVAESCGYDQDTVHMVSLPLCHNWPLTHGLLATFHAGGTLVLAPGPSPDVAFPLVEREGVTETGLVPGVALLWMEAADWGEHDLSSLRRVTIGGTKLQPEMARRVEPALGCRLQQAFGMAEGLCGFHRWDDPQEVVLMSQGLPVSPDDELRVVDEEDTDVAPGEVGQLLARGPYTVRGYYRAPEHNARTFTEDGFYRTGDLVRLLPTGHVVFEGRVKDQINRGGDKIAAEEVENHLLAHPNVREVALVGLPDEVLGERGCACVVPRGEAPTLAGLAAFLRERGVAAYKFPDRLEIVPALPATALGKVSKKKLIAMFG
ncbi:2,3-dihydroxybenzoate-AMP ligase [Sphaerisporangium melleum]|uniref:2,3-dihydroxybenzoate-AMP ligase n=1 Tax=Sphaerisporangium melleum TaxID=321316 RepID=A0A917RQL8_9ACTN|nr:AMP-binding protein [Sphaerisporangium melleum]GGL18638.1 2,3-dihydroxybenzoate-AMP ligase [Sphaerisporangium melleum]GII74921.1 2,3-dihydroxybenzoate-AMP ligase [Sphaerisporangium melleum]